MRSNLNKWIESCTDQLIDEFKDYEKETLLIRAFISRYEIHAQVILSQSRMSKYLFKIRKVFKKSREQSISFSSLEKNKKIDILFWPVQKNHIEVSEKIYSTFDNDEKIKSYVFSHNPPVIDRLKQSKIRNIIIPNNDLVPWSNYNNPTTKRILRSATKLESFIFGKKKMTFAQVLESAWYSYYYYYSYTIEIYNKIRKKYNPSLIFVGNDLTLVGQTVGLLSKRDGVKVASIQHGTINTDICKYSVADYFYVYGRNYYDLMLSKGIAKEKLIISGSPKIDTRLSQINSSGIFLDKYFLVAFSGPGHTVTISHHKEMLDLLLKVTKKYNNINFVCKLHKKDKLFYYSKFENQANVTIIEYSGKLNEHDIYDWLDKSFGIITGVSMSAVESMIMNKAVITIDLHGDMKKVDFIENGSTLHVKKYKDIEVYINAILKKDRLFDKHMILNQIFAKNAYFKKEGGSASFIVDHLKKILNEI